jgi:3-oxoadipate enol-lactonase
MAHLDVPGASLYYETAGDRRAPALLLIHAGIASLRMWDPQVDALASDHFVVRFDTRGFGLTRASGAAFSDRADATALLDRLGVARATVVGCSRGGEIAIDLALDAPDRVRGLVVVGGGPSGYPDQELTPLETQQFERLTEARASGEWDRLMRLETELWAIGPRRTASELDPAFVQAAYQLNAVNERHAGEELESEPLDPPAFGRLGEIAAPTLVMVGDEDISAVLDQYELLRGSIREAEGTVLMNTAHLPNVEKPVEFESLLIDWLARHHL